MDEKATFSLFVRRLPARRNFLLACGLDDVLSYFESLRFNHEDIDYLASLGRFTDAFSNGWRDSASPATSTPCPRARPSSRTSQFWR